MGILNRATLMPPAILAAICLAGPAIAQDLSPLTSFFVTIGETLTSTLGQAVALVALAAVGLLFMTGRMNWGFAASIAIGIVILFGAATILAGFDTA